MPRRGLYSPREIILPKAKLARSAISWGKFIMPIFIWAWFFISGGTARAMEISVNTVWAKAQSPIVVSENVWLKAGAVLTIEPGVVIKFDSVGSLSVSGKLTAAGTEAEPIIFTSIKDDAYGGDTNGDGAASQPAQGDWTTLSVGQGGEANLDYVLVQYGGGEYYTGAILSYKGTLNITNSIITKNNAAITLDLSTGAISHSSISDNIIPFVGGVMVDASISNNGRVDVIVDATNNWWGTVDGPCPWRQLAPPGVPIWQIDIEALCGSRPLVDLGVVYSPWLTQWPEPENEPTLEPVILVPGIMGSYLYSHTDPGVEVWPAVAKTVIDPWDLHLNQLIMDEQGNPLPNTMIVPPQDIIRTVLNKDFFEGLINELKQNGYEENKNLFVFPYDWRLDLNWSASGIPYSGFDSLKDKVEKVKLLTGAEKVNIIAHSMGGLVAKNYIKHYGAGSVDKFIDIGTPHLGAPEALKILMYGDNLGFEFNGYSLLNLDRVKIISQNFPSVYQILPSQNYFDSANSDYAYYIYDMHDLDNNGIKNRLDYAQSIDFMKNTGRNSALLEYNNALHSDLDNYSPKSDGIKTYNIMGCGQPTIGQIFVLNKEKSGGYEYGLKYISGDGTVPLRSAEALSADESYYIKEIEHAGLPSANGVKQIAAAMLEGTISSLSLTDYPAISRDSAGCSLNGTQISFHSPINLNVYDENDNHLGPNQDGDIEMGIAGAQYDDLDGNKFVFLPQGHDYRIIGQATDSGTFNARVQTIIGGQYTQTVYYNEAPLNSSTTVAKLQVNSGQPVGALELDQDGDQVFEVMVEPAAVLNQEEAGDLIKPETEISLAGILGDNGYYISTTTAVLAVADNQGGSGILKTEYSLNNGQSWQNYESQIIFNHDGEYNILYKSTDRAGNIEAEKEQKIKIDLAAPVINILIPLETQEFTRAEFFTPEYEITDDYSGAATGSLAVLIDDQPINRPEQDLFYYDLGEHTLKITVRDLAGNQAEERVKFTVSADLDSTISDVNRSYGLGWITNKTAKNWLNQELNEIKKYQEKFGQRQKKQEQKREKIMNQCLKKKNQAWCEKRLKNYNKVVYKLNQIHEKIIAKRYQEILKKLNDYYKKQWLNQSAYDIIKADINYLINNL